MLNMEIIGAGTAGVAIGWHGCMVLRPKLSWRSISYSLSLICGFGALAYWFGAADALIANAAGIVTGFSIHTVVCFAVHMRARRAS